MEGQKIKGLLISCLLILALANQAFAMDMFGGGGGGGSSSVASSSGGGKSNTSSNSNTNSGSSNTASSGSGSNSGTFLLATNNGNAAQGSTDGLNPTNGVGAVPELSTIFLLGSAMLGLLGLRKKIKK